MSRASNHSGHHHHHRRRRKKLLQWLPIVLAGLLIIVAFILAPSLQAPPPRPAPTGALKTEASPPARPDASISALPAVPVEAPHPPPQPAPPTADIKTAPTEAPRARTGAPPADAGVRPAPSAAPVAHQTPGDEASKDAGARSKRRRISHTARQKSDPDDASAADLSVRWNQ